MLTERDEKILGALVRHIRLATLDQIARGWWPENVGRINATRRLQRLEKSGWVHSLRVFARPLLPLDQPEVSWQPGVEMPPFPKISLAMKNRWKEPARQCRVFAASKRAKCALAGREQRPVKNFCQVTHDLHVTEIFLCYLETWPAEAARWLGEDEIASTRRHQVLPDAMLADPSGHPIRAIEFGGSYSAERLREFHLDCERRRLSYEVW